MSQGFNLIDDSEQEDFEGAITSKGLNVSDFEISQNPNQTTHPITNISGTITIQYKPTQKAITYNAGTGSSWPMSFQHDLNTGKFK